MIHCSDKAKGTEGLYAQLITWMQCLCVLSLPYPSPRALDEITCVCVCVTMQTELPPLVWHSSFLRIIWITRWFSKHKSVQKEGKKSSLGQYMLQLALLSEISAVIPFKLNHFNANVLSLNEVQTHQCQQQLQLNPPHKPLGAKFNSRTLQILHIQQPLSIFVIYRDC